MEKSSKPVSSPVENMWCIAAQDKSLGVVSAVSVWYDASNLLVSPLAALLLGFTLCLPFL